MPVECAIDNTYCNNMAAFTMPLALFVHEINFILIFVSIESILSSIDCCSRAIVVTALSFFFFIRFKFNECVPSSWYYFISSYRTLSETVLKIFNILCFDHLELEFCLLDLKRISFWFGIWIVMWNDATPSSEGMRNSWRNAECGKYSFVVPRNIAMRVCVRSVTTVSHCHAKSVHAN